MPDRFFEGYPTRVVVANLDHEALMTLDKFANPLGMTKTRNAPTEIRVGTPSDSRQINLLADDGDPFIDEGNRLVGLFRREGVPGSPGTGEPWVCRGAGIALDIEDNTNSDAPLSNLIAYDSWKYLYRRQVTIDDAGSLPVPTGHRYEASTGNSIIIEQLERTEAAFGTTRLDWGQVNGGADYEGTIETTPVIEEIIFQRGTTLGEMLDQLVQTGTLDVVIEPIWDPFVRPGIIGELSIYESAEVESFDQVFGWDVWPRNVPQVTRQVKGTERANRTKFFSGVGGIPTPGLTDPVSIARNGVYHIVQFTPGKTSPKDAELTEIKYLASHRDGQFFYTFVPATNRSPAPFKAFDVHHIVQLRASKRLRRQFTEFVKVESLGFAVQDDLIERYQVTVSIPDVDAVV